MWAIDQHGNKRKLMKGDVLQDGEYLLGRMIADAVPPSYTLTDSYGRMLATGHKSDNHQNAYEARVRDAWR